MPHDWDDTQPGYYDTTEEEIMDPRYYDDWQPPPEPTAKPPITDFELVEVVRMMAADLWSRHKADRCQCPECVASHVRQPGRKGIRSPGTAARPGWPVGSGSRRRGTA